jgi:hypothetical protein
MRISMEVQKYGNRKFRQNSVPTEFRGLPSSRALKRSNRYAMPQGKPD